LLSGILILLPLASRRFRHTPSAGITTQTPSLNRFPMLRPLLYFILIGLAYLLVEIPLIQHFILYLGQPAYAMSVVLFSLLLFSAVGSALANRLPRWLSHQLAPGALALFLLGVPFLLPPLFARTLGLPLPFRLILTVVVLAPIGLLMGMPFPAGIRWLMEGPEPRQAETAGEKGIEATRIPWVWAANGASSVVASILAALLALSFGFRWVLRAGAFCYVGALLTVMAAVWRLRSRSPHR
jgi:MFS family permease